MPNSEQCCTKAKGHMASAPVPIVASCARPPPSEAESPLSVTFSISPEPIAENSDEEDFLEEVLEKLDHSSSLPESSHQSRRHSANNLLHIPHFNRLRRLSDRSLQRILSRLRWFTDNGRSSSSSPSSTPSNSPPKANPPKRTRNMSVVDANGILKGQRTQMTPRKCVSFCEQDTVRLFERTQDEVLPALISIIQDETTANEDEVDDHPSRTLVPSFPLASSKPEYRSIFRKKVLILEDFEVTEDFCLMGRIRLNVTKLRFLQTPDERRREQKLVLGASYTRDGWATKRDVRAYVVRNNSHPALEGFPSHCMRFAIDCSDLQCGESLSFMLWCAEMKPRLPNKQQTDLYDIRFKDDNDGHFYTVTCTPLLNMWAAKAAKELKGFAPTIKFNKVQ